MNLSKNTKDTLDIPYTAAGQATTTGAILDMSGFEGVKFTFAIGTIATTGTVVCTVESDTAVGGGTMAALTGAAITYAAADQNKIAVIDIYRPAKRYIRASVVTAVANGIIGSVVATQYDAHAKPTTNDTTTTKGTVTLASPA